MLMSYSSSTQNKSCLVLLTETHGYSKICVKQPLSKRQKVVFQDQFSLIVGKGSILQYFRPTLSYHLSLRVLFCLVFEWSFKAAYSVTMNIFRKILFSF